MGKALDIGHALAFAKTEAAITGGSDMRLTSGSDVLVVTAGMSRRPGMTREDLLGVNAGIVRSLLFGALEYSPDAVVIIVTNPVNTMTCLAATICEIPKSRIIGMAGALDDARFTYFIEQELKCGFRAIKSWVIGDHGDRVVPVVSHTTVHGRPLNECLTPEQLAEICAKTRSAGTQIVNYLQDGSAFMAPGRAVLKMLRSVFGLETEPLPCSVYLNGEYGERGLVVGVPARLGNAGVLEVIEIALTDEENSEFKQSVMGIREVNQSLYKLSAMMAKNVV